MDHPLALLLALCPGLRSLRAIACLAALASTTAYGLNTARMAEIVDVRARNNGYMGSVLVAAEGKILFEKSCGSANLEWQVPNTGDTRFRIGSVTKQFTAAAILLLAEQGKLKLDDTLGKLLPQTPEAWHPATVEQLLHHRTGIPSVTDLPDYNRWKVASETPAVTIAHVKDLPLVAKHGEQFRYNNTGYILLGWIVEVVSGQPYAAFVQEHFFTPLGMKDTRYDSNSDVIPRRATGYIPGTHGPAHADFIDMHTPGGAGGLVSTTRDLLKWNEGLFGGRLLSPASLEKMLKPQENGYACGIGVLKRQGRTVYTHGGGIDGFNSDLSYYPEGKVTVVALSNINGNDAGALGSELAALYFGGDVTLAAERTEVSLPVETLREYAGRYALAPTFIITVTEENGVLCAQATNQSKLPMFASARDEFFYKIVDAQVSFKRDEAGKVTSLVLHQNGQHVPGPRQ